MQVSVVVPVKDDAVALARCLRALAEQTVAPWEVLVVDDSSVDDSAEVARSFGARVLTHDGAGIPASSACGYDAARGELIARLDADSVPPPDWIERVVRCFERGDVDAVTGPGRFVGFGPVRQMLARLVYMDAYFFWMGLALAHWPLYGSALAMRRSVWLAVGPRMHRADARLHDDVDLSLHVGLRYRIAFEQTLAVGVEGSIFADTRGMLRRYERAFYTLYRHGAAGLPLLRWRRRLLLALRR
ncbi:glycosyltransferase family 2 protein [Microbacteriaceae bacterium VKM Ac-2854]|nr:glycosyltransferase family 2 protein [Microbacteriaceae bacterium VKM Ac-2854]